MKNQKPVAEAALKFRALLTLKLKDSSSSCQCSFSVLVNVLQIARVRVKYIIYCKIKITLGS